MKPKVLVIDDEYFIRELVKDFLEVYEIHCDEAATPDIAYDLISGNNYNLILIDRNLGKVQAADVIRQIRSLGSTTPILLITGDSGCSPEYLAEIGAAGVIYKPFQVGHFIEVINRHMEQ